jgi:hypothetical protein
MSDPLVVQKNPCPSCPYRRDCPSGVWSHDEYEKLRRYDDRNAFLPVFLCHQSNAGPKTACKGWLTVHADSIAVRLAFFAGQVTVEQVNEEPTVKLFTSGRQAANAGQRAIRRPGQRAKRMCDSLVRKGVGRPD